MVDMIGKSIAELNTPCFLVDIDKVKSNCDRMLATCTRLGVSFRAHMKTAKTLEAGCLQTNGTKRGIVVSTLAEAEFFADGGFDDILYTNSPTVDKIPRCQKLLSKLEKFHLMVDSDYTINLLEQACPPGLKWSVFMKVDTGYLRAGVLWNSSKAIELAKRLCLSPSIMFRGIYTHEGNSYTCQSAIDARSAFETTASKLSELAGRLKTSADINCECVSMGATPTCSRPGISVGAVTELHAGNYVFYDCQQLAIGSCDVDDIACKVATRILGCYPEKNRLLTDSGFTALSHDGITNEGLTVLFEDNSDLKLFGVTQEIGKVCAARNKELDYTKYPAGTMLFILPYHSCATAAMHPVYYVHKQGKVIAAWRPVRGW